MTDVNQAPVSEEPKAEEVVTQPAAVLEPSVEPKPGEKTDPAELLKSLREERERRRIAEEALAQKNAEMTVTEPISDEGKFLASRIQTLEARIAAEEEEKRLLSLQSSFPALRDKRAEFDTFRTNPDNAGMKLETAARAFLVENNLLTPQEPRKGLEKPSGGGRVAPTSDMTADDVRELRTNNYRKYVKLLAEGKIKL